MSERSIDKARRIVLRAFARVEELEGRRLLSNSITTVMNPPLSPPTVTYDLSPPFGGWPSTPGVPNPVFDHIPNLPPGGGVPDGPVAPDGPPNMPGGPIPAVPPGVDNIPQLPPSGPAPGGPVSPENPPNMPGGPIPAAPQSPDVTPPVGYISSDRSPVPF